jgi:hypothetical protein
MVSAIGAGYIANDAGDRAGLMQVAAGGPLQVRIMLQQEAELAIVSHGFLRRRQRAVAVDGHRHDGAREQHQIAHRNDHEHVVGDRVHDIAAGRRALLGLRILAR